MLPPGPENRRLVGKSILCGRMMTDFRKKWASGKLRVSHGSIDSRTALFQELLINPQILPGIRPNDVLEISLAKSSLLSAPTHSRSGSKGTSPSMETAPPLDEPGVRTQPKRLVLQAVFADKDILAKQPQLQVALFLSLCCWNDNSWNDFLDVFGPDHCSVF
jgi:hypothetical protein